nr:sel1 repeat family protein [Deltaproteobacteria bacterium]
MNDPVAAQLSADRAFDLGHRAELARNRGEAIRLYELAADAGSAPAARRRGLLALQLSFSETWRLGGDAIEALRAEAERWLRRAVALGREDAWEDVAFAIRCRASATPEDMCESESARARAAEAPASDRVARLLSDLGDSDTPSPAPHELPTLLPWLTSADERGDTWATWLLGRLVDSGDAPGGQALALSHWQRGAERGDARCAFELGLRIEKKKKKEATALYERSAAGGFGLAALRLGHLAKTWKDAERWYLRAIELGRTDAWIDIARHLTSGAKGAPVDLARASRGWELAAEGGASGAVAVAAEMFDEGEFAGHPIGRDPVKARRFAEQGMDLGSGEGVPRCQFVMAKQLATGEGGPVDREGAALWSRVAARRSDPVSERARVLHEEIWGSLDDAARQRVIERDRELHPGVDVGESG